MRWVSLRKPRPWRNAKANPALRAFVTRTTPTMMPPNWPCCSSECSRPGLLSGVKRYVEMTFGARERLLVRVSRAARLLWAKGTSIIH